MTYDIESKLPIIGSSLPVTFKTTILRPDDLLNLHVEGINLEVNTENCANPVLVPIIKNQPAFLIVHFPPQAIGEQAFYEVDDTEKLLEPQIKQIAGKEYHRNLTDDENSSAGFTTLESPGQVSAYISGPTRLVFRVPSDICIPFTTEGLLDWSKFELSVAPIADVADNAEPPASALTIRAPEQIESKIELPYRLHLSPTHDVIWDHVGRVVSHKGYAELWHTRLASLTPDHKIQRTDNDHTLPLRAIWSPDYKSGSLQDINNPGPIGKLSSMIPYDRDQIVKLTSDFNSKPYKPLPIQTSLLMLSPLGGWLRASGTWNPPNNLDVTQWTHIASQGRDHYTRIVYKGRLKWTGHTASLVKVTERRFEKFQFPDGKTGPVAYLRQYMYIVVSDPEIDYNKEEGLQNEGRGMPLKKIRLTTLVTPKIDYPYSGKPRITDRSFWVMVSGNDFLFHAIAEDIAGNKINFTTPMIFVPNSEDENNYKEIHNAFTTPESVERRNLSIQGQKVTFAPPVDGNENTSFVTQALNLENEGADKNLFFKPKLFKADIRIQAVEKLTGKVEDTTIQFSQKYLEEKGFDNLDNVTGVFAEILNEQLDLATLGVQFTAQQAGGFATPNLGISCLSRNLGPLGGKIENALKNTFDPRDIFESYNAQLFGAFDLADLLPSGSADKYAPKMQVRREGSVVITELDWKSKVNSYELNLINFNAQPNTQLVVNGVFKTNLGSPTNEDYKLTGDLNDFNIEFADVIKINFLLFSFKAQNGKKTDVNVELDSTKPVEFEGDLEFVEELRNLIPPTVFGPGVSIDLIAEPLGVKASLEITLPPASVGVFSLQNILFSAGLTIPFSDGKPNFDFAFARRDHPFLLAVSFFGGAGFFHIELDTSGIRMLEAAFEFGAVAALDIGVASGEVHMMAGIYFKMEQKAVLTGYMRCGGELSVLGLVSVSVEFYLCFTYIPLAENDPHSGKAYGRATVTVSIDFLFFSKSVDLTVERGFGGKSGDPTFADLMDSPQVWEEYACAFA